MLDNENTVYSKKAVSDYVLSVSNPSLKYFKNVLTDIDELCLSNKMTLPITINNTEYENSYVCSPYTALVPYCKEELSKVDSLLIQRLVSSLLSIFDLIFKKLKINKVFQMNNWMLSTNLYPISLNESEINQSKINVTKKYSKHLLMYRSLNYHTNEKLIDDFLKSGFSLIPSRQVYIFDKKIKDYSKTHNYQIDKKLLSKTNYTYAPQNEILISDIPRIVELYNLLYIDKYSEHNPKFTESFITSIINHPYFYLEGFRGSDGVLDAIGGRFEMDGIVTLPIVGYDTSKPQKIGLYRLVMISSLLYAEDNNLVFNASSGAPSFKSLRGATPHIEYSAIYFDHLTVFRKGIWITLKFLLQYTFIPIMKRYKL